MQYANYKELIIQKYGIELQGWTFEKLVNPSLLSTSLPGLRHLLDAINNRDCKFTKLSPLEVKNHCEELEKKQNEGTAPVKTRKPHRDHGTKRPRGKGNKQGLEHDDNDKEQEEEEQPHKRPKSTEIIPAENNDWALISELYVFQCNLIKHDFPKHCLWHLYQNCFIKRHNEQRYSYQNCFIKCRNEQSSVRMTHFY